MRKQITELAIIAGLSLAALLGHGCVTTWQYASAPVVSKSKAYSIEIPKGWTYIQYPDLRLVSTYDGPGLQSIEVGERLVGKELEFSKKTIEADYSAEKLVEVMFAELSQNPNRVGARLESAGPAELAGRSGATIVYTYSNDDGLKYRESVTGTVYKDKFYSVAFRAPVRHYYDKYDDVLGQVLESFRLTK